MDTGTPPEGNLGFEDCWELLETGIVGRLALVVDDRPDIFPVNYVLERRSIVFRSAGGKKLWGAQAGRPAAFEIDGYDPRQEEAWSVVVRAKQRSSAVTRRRPRWTPSTLNRGSPEPRTTTSD